MLDPIRRAFEAALSRIRPDKLSPGVASISVGAPVAQELLRNYVETILKLYWNYVEIISIMVSTNQ
jgi:hypothetical protein